jgi:hypothetical protein
MSKESDRYWRSAAEDESMQGAHEFVWKATLQTIEVDLRGRRVLDVGCNWVLADAVRSGGDRRGLRVRPS